MKIVFLDFDGVLNSTKYFSAQNDGIRDVDGGLDRKAVALLNNLIERTNALVVVSSTWRIGQSVEQLQKTLVDVGFTGTVIDKTPQFTCPPYQRGNEIQSWINMRGVFSGMTSLCGISRDFVILDDDIDMAHLANNHVKTKIMTGLTKEDVDYAVSILNGTVSFEVVYNRKLEESRK